MRDPFDILNPAAQIERMARIGRSRKITESRRRSKEIGSS
jgi:hypothetical protein